MQHMLNVRTLNLKTKQLLPSSTGRRGPGSPALIHNGSYLRRGADGLAQPCRQHT